MILFNSYKREEGGSCYKITHEYTSLNSNTFVSLLFKNKCMFRSATFYKIEINNTFIQTWIPLLKEISKPNKIV